MTTIHLGLDYYSQPKDKLIVHTERDDGYVSVDLSGLEDGTNTDVSLLPDEARSLAAILVAQAKAVER